MKHLVLWQSRRLIPLPASVFSDPPSETNPQVDYDGLTLDSRQALLAAALSGDPSGRRGAAIVVTVTNSAGEPVKGARVYVSSTARDMHRASRDIRRASMGSAGCDDTGMAALTVAADCGIRLGNFRWKSTMSMAKKHNRPNVPANQLAISIRLFGRLRL